jgi:hypothetical protein
MFSFLQSNVGFEQTAIVVPQASGGGPEALTEPVYACVLGKTSYKR